MLPDEPYVELDAYEIGQLVALIPYSAWSRMDNRLREKLQAARKRIDRDREIAAELRKERRR